MKHVFLANYYKESQQDNNNGQPEQKQWYETLWGLVILSVGLDLLSNFIYDQGRERLRLMDKRRQKQRDIDFLKQYEGQTDQQARESEQAETDKLDREQAEGDFSS